MRYLLNFIFDNLVPIIIVTSVAIRIITGMKKGAARKRSAPPVSTPAAVPRSQPDDRESDVWSRLRPDDDDDDDEDDEDGEAAAEALPQAIRPLLMRAPDLGGPLPPPPVNPDPGIARPFDPVAVGIEPIAAEPKRGLPRAAPGPGPSPLDRLNSLSPLRRAVVLAEILGKPKGMEQ
jgi:hypothetical protein